jgi:sugar (pentulose or hexulose) kinase
MGTLFRAALEAIAYLIRLGIEAHERAGQQITRITVSGGIARSDLMCEILASVLNRRLERLVSAEGPALGAAVTALAGVETLLRRQHGVQEPFSVADAVATMVRYAAPVNPNPEWVPVYEKEMVKFRERLEAFRASLNP